MIVVMSEKLPKRRGELRTVQTHGGIALRYIKGSHEEWNPSRERLQELRAK